jgi:membrane protein implicated in regulation of membrane protease activity
METDTPKSTFSSPRVLTGMVLMCVGLVIALCVLIIFFRGTWYLPALFAALTIGTVVAYLCWLDVQDFSLAKRTTAPGPDAEALPEKSDQGKKETVREEIPESFTILPGKEPLIVETGPLYATFTHPKAVTSMLLIGIGLGLALSLLISQFRGQWYMPVAFAAFALATVFLYMYWLERQDFGDE